MSKIWVTSDTHFGHTNIIGFCDRPYMSVQEMNRDLIDRWNAKVDKADTVIHIGDFALCMPKEEIRDIIQTLNGYKILVRGNHDPSLSQMAKLGFNVTTNKLVLDDVTFVHIPPHFKWEEHHKKYIYGHVHNKPHAKPSKKCYNACVEVNNYEPRLLTNIKFTYK